MNKAELVAAMATSADITKAAADSHKIVQKYYN
jgi:hypothetical protein